MIGIKMRQYTGSRTSLQGRIKDPPSLIPLLGKNHGTVTKMTMSVEEDKSIGEGWYIRVHSLTLQLKFKTIQHV